MISHKINEKRHIHDPKYKGPRFWVVTRRLQEMLVRQDELGSLVGVLNREDNYDNSKLEYKGDWDTEKGSNKEVKYENRG